MRPHSSTPGAGWVEIITRPNLASFSRAFVVEPILETLAAPGPVSGPAAIRGFFQVTRTMFDSIAFTREINCDRVTYLEWEGVFAGAPISGTTTLERDAAGRIERIRLAYFPFAQLIALAIALLGPRYFAQSGRRHGAPASCFPIPDLRRLPCV